MAEVTAMSEDHRAARLLDRCERSFDRGLPEGLPGDDKPDRITPERIGAEEGKSRASLEKASATELGRGELG